MSETTLDTRTVPHDMDAEMAALGGMLLTPSAAADVAELLNAADFYRPAHQTIYRAAAALMDRGDPVDAISVNAELDKLGEINRVGGAPYLHTLAASIPTAANAAYYARIVADKALLRRLVETGTRVAQIGYTGEGEAAALVEDAQAEMMAITSGAEPEEDAFFRSFMPQVVAGIEDRANADTNLVGLPTGLNDLDELTRGFRPGQLITVGARPSLGKSTLALDMVRAASVNAEDPAPAAFFSLEMGRNELGERLLSAQARVAFTRIQAGTVDDADWARMAEAMPRINAAPVAVRDDVNDLRIIRSVCRRMKATTGLRLVVVDYLQLVETGERSENRQQDVSAVSGALKAMAKELGVTVIALSQLNRGPESRDDKKPRMSELRESGSIEQDSDMVILLHRDDFYDQESVRAGEADLFVVKHRNGPTATLTAAFQGHYARFMDMARG
ncbi:replicative DNA helicase [Streptomonospora salina]|uniref:Replicative DNA helicase n=1 Tax=Streptomonospora salina TaxID=104205 RepID=A0A841EDY0_9ACTN|nr:replicative DNA helicase [Streptomonospora salina]MBB6001345.1 replicative DNA helicase [Streptomonospora salina]